MVRIRIVFIVLAVVMFVPLGLLVQNALNQQRVFVHRDYHSRNLMLTAENNPGILDFQDALEGPLTYDLVSLLKDCYVSWPEETVRKRALDFHGQLGDGDRDAMSADEFLRTVPGVLQITRKQQNRHSGRHF